MFFPDHGHKFDISIYYFCFEGGGWTEGVDGVGMVADPEQDWTGGGGGGAEDMEGRSGLTLLLSNVRYHTLAHSRS
jgi:hypothetical protein